MSPQGANLGIPINFDLAERVDLFRNTLVFEGLGDDHIKEIAGLAFAKRFAKGDSIFYQDEPCEFLHVVARGLVKVSICSFSGSRITYLLADRGDPLNLVGPFTGSPRFISAEALGETIVVHVKREDFLSFAIKNPVVIVNIISILGSAIDSANGRIIDMIEKPVEQRLLKVLYTLYDKFGDTLKFTSNELAELAGTTTESTLRAMGRLRKRGIITSGRGEVSIIKPAKLKQLSDETLWV
jgi:CRP-like cAMP-binding protein